MSAIVVDLPATFFVSRLWPMIARLTLVLVVSVQGAVPGAGHGAPAAPVAAE